MSIYIAYRPSQACINYFTNPSEKLNDYIQRRRSLVYHTGQLQLVLQLQWRHVVHLYCRLFAVYTYIQSRFYRAPEVILGMPYTTAIDMWSLGCIVAELHLGYPLLPGEDEVEQLACSMELLGLPPFNVLRNASRLNLFFGI